MSVVLIGIGNTFRRDDGIGIVIVNALRQRIGNRQQLSFLECSGEGAELMELWSGYDKVLLFDAVLADQVPGTVHRLDARVNSIPSDFFKYSSHAFSLAEAVEMARVLDRLPDEMVIYGVEGSDFEHGEGLSSSVKEAVEAVVQQVLSELGSAGPVSVDA